MSKSTGGPAYPRAHGEDPGMTLRDYFAGQALPQCIAEYGLTGKASVVEAAYKYADAMLKERDR